MFFFALLISIITGVLFGLAPALQAANPNHIDNLREGGRGSTASRRHTRLSRALVVLEVALSMILLAGTGLLLRSFWRVLEVRPGFNPTHLTTVQIWIPQPNDPATDPYIVVEKRADFLLEIVSPCVGASRRGAGIAFRERHPTHEFRHGITLNFRFKGVPRNQSATRSRTSPIVDTKYFRTMEVPLTAGRNFTGFDTYKTQAVAVIDQTLAQQYWPGKDPLGNQVKFGFGRGVEGRHDRRRGWRYQVGRL